MRESSPRGVVTLAEGSNHTCSIDSAGAVACWGMYASERLGNGTTTGSATPVAVAGLTGVNRIAASIDGTCARDKDGAIACWGKNWHGQIGNGTTVNALTPVNVLGL